jgi:hypothetical protein
VKYQVGSSTLSETLVKLEHIKTKQKPTTIPSAWKEKASKLPDPLKIGRGVVLIVET